VVSFHNQVILAPQQSLGHFQMQKLAHIELKMDKIGSSIPVLYVSPAQVMFLVADHHSRAGGNPVVKFKPIPDDAEKPEMDKLQAVVEKYEKELEALEELELTQEIRERREESYRARIQQAESRLGELRQIVLRRKFTAAQERDFLVSKYGKKRVKAMFPGAIPQLPTDFAEAQQVGVQSEIPGQRLFTAGEDEKQEPQG